MKKNLVTPILVFLLLLLPFTGCKKIVVIKVSPTVTTAAVSNITTTSAACGGSVSTDGGAAVTSRGVCWSISQSPTTSDSKTSDGTGVGSFTSAITGLLPGTTYYVRAYAVNSVGTAYGSQMTLATTAVLAVLTTTAASSVASTTATSGGNITSDGGAAVTARGVCWGTITNPTTSNAKTTDGSQDMIAPNAKTTDGTGAGTFISLITLLTPGTVYYVRAYAVNSIGTAYGNQITLTTSTAVPTLTTTDASGITSTTANSGGNITSDGGATVTARGVCWSTSQSPTTSNSKTTNGNGTGTFTSLITALAPGTTYYARAYATNSAGTAYGNQITIVTPATLPTVTTTSLTGVTATSANSGGTITSDGGAAITAKGVCWNTSPSPTTANQKTNNGTGSATFTSAISGLTAGVTYYVRAYATNSAGTAYGNELRANGLSDDINNLVPQSIIDELKRMGMPINTGVTPPIINGIFDITQFVMTNTNIEGDYAIGTRFNDMHIQFSLQNNQQLTLTVDYVSFTTGGTESSSAHGTESYIVGSGKLFTVFVKLISTRTGTNETADNLVVVSGSLEANSINNLYYSLIMLDNHGFNGPGQYIANGKGRVFYDLDGVSEKIQSLRTVQVMTKSNSLILPDPSSKKN